MKIENDTPLPAFAVPGLGPQDRAIVTIVVKGTFDLVPGDAAQLAAQQAPIAFADEVVEIPGGVLPRLDSDVAPFKPRADVILLGRACAPGGKPASHVDVRFRVGRHSKTLRVFGAREWKPGGLGREPRISEPEAFRECELSWTYGYGGGASLANPPGIGWIHENPKIRKKDIEGQPLPRIEDPTNLIESWQDRPAPAGFGTVGRGWEPRLSYLGTYDERWKSERSPLPPRDFDFAFHNAAPEDQQLEFLRGDETFAIVNATADGRLDGALPATRPLVTLRRGSATTDEGVAMKIDTAIFEPDAKRLTLLWRATPAIPAMENNDVAEIRVKLAAS